MAVSCEYGNEPSGSIKGREFLEQLSDCHSRAAMFHGVS
jgi:hypothetical protein